VNLLGGNIETIKRNTGSLIDASKEVGPDVNLEKTKYMLASRYYNARKNRALKVANKSEECRLLRHIPEDGILQSHCRENLKSYIRCCKYSTFQIL
jgi:hypothetical protein